MPLQPLRERKRTRIARAALLVGTASLAVSTFLAGMRHLGWMQPLELGVYDRMVQFSPDQGVDPRLLVVGITEADIQQQQRFPLSDRTIAQLLKTLQTHKPRAIGLDLLRDIPQTPGQAELRQELKAPNLVAIMSLGTANIPATPAPPGVPPERVGFNDLVTDEDNVVRRNFMYGDRDGKQFYSFSFQLAQAYLAKEPQVKSTQLDPITFQIGKAKFHPLEKDSGGYQSSDVALGYQILLRYRGKQAAREVSLNQLLAGQVKPEWIQDKIVLIGTTAISARDLFLTPYSSAAKDSPKLAGVLVHAYNTSQILSAILDGHGLVWFWSEWVENLWILGWAGLGGGLAWCVRRPIALGISGTLLLILLGGIGFGLWLQAGWVPIVVPGLAATATGGVVVAYRAYGK